MAGLDGFEAVRRGGSDEDTRLAHPHLTNPVSHRQPNYGVLLAALLADVLLRG